MTSKAPKKKESKDHVNANLPKGVSQQGVPVADDKLKKKPSIPIWSEWSEQDVANEKWDLGKKERERGRSPNAPIHYFEDPDGRIELPSSLDHLVHSWNRPSDLIHTDKVPVIVDSNHLTEQNIDLLTPNQHLTSSELICTIISTLTSLFQSLAPKSDYEVASSLTKLKMSQKEAKDSKAEKSRKEFLEPIDETSWRPWDLIWPKENVRPNSLPVLNSAGKYAVKLFWMGSYRKIIVDDTIPCDIDMKPLLPFTCSGNELWPLIMTKALIKIASLDYFGGDALSEIGDVSIIHCLTGWLPEPIPMEKMYTERVWKLLLKLLPNWKPPQPHAPPFETHIDAKASLYDGYGLSKQELSMKESKERVKNNESKATTKDVKPRTDARSTKDKVLASSSANSRLDNNLPNHLLFATFSKKRRTNNSTISELKVSDTSGKLQEFGLSHCYPHPVHLSVVRNCPLIPPPTPVEIPRWKLIRQKKKNEPVQPSFHVQEVKEPKFVEIQSPFFNYRVSQTPTNELSSSKLDKSEEDSVKTAESYLSMPVNPESGDMVVENKEIKEIKGMTENKRVTSADSEVGTQSPSKIEKKSKEHRRSPETAVNIVLTDADDASTLSDVKSDEKRNLWIDFQEFYQCFSTLWIFHKQKTNIRTMTDMKIFDGKSEKGKKTSGHNILNSGRNTALSATSFLNLGYALSDIPPPYLLVDCLQETEILVSLASFSRWFDPSLNVDKEDREAWKQANTPIPGSLVLEPYSWKRIVVPAPILKIRTTGISSAVLTLPAGRHVMRLMITAPLGYNVQIASNHAFIFGDELSIMQHLTKESLRFVSHGVDVLKQLGEVVQTFKVPSTTTTSSTTTSSTSTVDQRTVKLILGTENKSNKIRKDHFCELFKSLVNILRAEMGPSFNAHLTFAMKALQFHSYYHLNKFSKEQPRMKHRTCSAPSFVIRPDDDADDTGNMINLSLPALHLGRSIERERCATKIQACFKRYYTVKLMSTRKLGTVSNTKTFEQLNKIWSYMESNVQALAVSVYRHMFSSNPLLFSSFPFYSDEWNKISFVDYNGSYTEQQPDTWFVICRGIFHVHEALMVLPKFYCNARGAHLKVIDNDTLTEVKTVFQQVVPQVLQKNKTGYTFVAVSYGDENVLPAGKFRLRLLGEREPLPSPVRESPVTSNFFVNEIKDYYTPNQRNRIFRYSLKTSEDLLATLHFFTSADEVYVKIQIIDDEEILYEAEGKKYVTVPIHLFRKDRLPDNDDGKTSEASTVGGSGRLSGKGPNKRGKSISPEKSIVKSIETKLNVEEEQTHKYYIQGFVVQNSWPLTKKQWDFVESLKIIEEEVIVVEPPVATPLPVKVETPNKTSPNKSRRGARETKDAKRAREDRDTKEKGEAKEAKDTRETKVNRSRPESRLNSAFDKSQAHWTLKVVVDSTMDQLVEVKRDTEREDEIRAIKKAWEIHEPGRAAKARVSRAKYLESHALSAPTGESEDGGKFNEENVIQLLHDGNADNAETGTKDNKGKQLENKQLNEIEQALSTTPTLSEVDTGEVFYVKPAKDTDVILTQLDVTPFLRSSGKKVLLDEQEEDRKRFELEKKFQDYNDMREMVLNLREDGRLERNLLKQTQLEKYEAMQIQLDSAREELYKARETFFNKFLPQPEAVDIPEVVTEKKKRTPSPKHKKHSSKGKKK